MNTQSGAFQSLPINTGNSLPKPETREEHIDQRAGKGNHPPLGRDYGRGLKDFGTPYMTVHTRIV